MSPTTIPVGKLTTRDVFHGREALILYCESIMKAGLFPGSPRNDAINLMDDGMRIALGRVIDVLKGGHITFPTEKSP